MTGSVPFVVMSGLIIRSKRKTDSWQGGWALTKIANILRKGLSRPESPFDYTPE